MLRRYPTTKKSTDPTFSAEWSGVTGAPRISGVRCSKCAGPVHREADSAYCPSCDNYVTTEEGAARRPVR